jgi:repressor LexA
LHFSPIGNTIIDMARHKSLEKQYVLAVIQDWIADRGVPPTIEELRRKLNVGSGRTVLRYLQWLEEEGDIQRWSGARGIRPLKSFSPGLETVAVPIAGEAPAGPLMVAEENIEGWVRLPKEFVRHPQTGKNFLLRVRGDSMNRAKITGDLIESGDLVLVRQQSTADSGDVVVALIDGETTIKRFMKGTSYSLLKPETSNPIHKPIVVQKGFRVLGVVCRVLKKASELLSHIEE